MALFVTFTSYQLSMSGGPNAQVAHRVAKIAQSKFDGIGETAKELPWGLQAGGYRPAVIHKVGVS